MKGKKEVIHTKIWNEVPEDDNPFAAKQCFCAGYDVYGDLLGKVRWAEYLYLLFKLEKPTKQQAELLEAIAISIANPGIRDHSVRAAMNAGVGGSTSASTLMAALAVGAGQYGGAREVYLFVNLINKCKQDLKKWEFNLASKNFNSDDVIWNDLDHYPGFDPNGITFPTPTSIILEYLNGLSEKQSCLNWVRKNRKMLESFTDAPLSITGVIASALYDLGFSEEQAEMIYLILRLPGAAVHALEQRKTNWRDYPFFNNEFNLKEDSDNLV